MLSLNLSPDKIVGLPDYERGAIAELVKVFDYHKGKNADKNRYYEGKVSLGSVNLGIALPEGLAKLEIGCAWGAKTVDVLAGRSVFDGYVGTDGETDEVLDQLVIDNNLVAEYQKACRDELKYGCTFATLSQDPEIGCKIRFHSPETAAALWNGEKNRIACGLVVLDTVPDEEEASTWHPSRIGYYTDEAVWIFTRRGRSEVWDAEMYPHMMGRPLMEAMIWNATSDKPFGRSRIKEPIRRLIDGYVRTIANATIGLEFSTTPQKYLLGVSDEQFDVVVNQKFRQYVGSILASTSNPDTGEKPTFGQLTQGTISPHVEMIRVLATQFSAATGLTVTDTGVVSEANPTSADAVLAQSQTLIATAEQLNTVNGNSLRSIAMMALAITADVSLADLPQEERDIVAHFKNPAMPSVAATTDAAMKIAASRPAFADTDTFLEMIGFSQADIRRIKAQEQRARGLQLISDIEAES